MLTFAPMFLRALHRQILAGLVLFALLLQMLLPAVAGAASDSGERWIEVCAASGVKWIKLDHATAGDQHAAADHCALCAATGATPEFDSARYLTSALTEVRLAAAPAASFFTFPGHRLRSRAPPKFS